MDILYNIFYSVIERTDKILTRDHVLEILRKIDLRTYVFIIPGHIDEIEAGAFSDIDSISLLIIYGKIKEIPSFCFDNCHGLKVVSIYSESIEKINLNAFNNCTNLRYINLTDKLKYIGEGAFFNCLELDLKYLPDNLNYLGRNSFFRCKKITLTHLPDSIKYIKEYTFQACESIKSFYVKPNVGIDNFAFSDCPKLESFFGNLEQMKGISIFMNNTGTTFYLPDKHSKLNAIRANYWSIKKHLILEKDLKEVIRNIFFTLRIKNNLPTEIIINIIKQINMVNFGSY